ncbi:MAG: hypothetical protein H0T62_08025 [Parachlamydiaceae bacterium]|nr:hypothetical protein [Parachlamydiaceae bacterium]
MNEKQFAGAMSTANAVIICNHRHQLNAEAKPWVRTVIIVQTLAPI